jgi:hypothetical protein
MLRCDQLTEDDIQAALAHQEELEHQELLQEQEMSYNRTSSNLERKENDR